MFPASRRLPHFNRESLEKALPAAGIEYIWEKDLGGRRKKQPGESLNIALRNDSFRNYADYMLTPGFLHAIDGLLQLAVATPTAIMCSERQVYWHCHRMLVADYLALQGHEVLHIDNEKPAKPHRITPEAKLIDGQVIYPGLFA